MSRAVSSAGTYGAAMLQTVYPPGTSMTGVTFYVMRIHYGYGASCGGSTAAVPVLVQNGNTTGGTGGTMRFQAANLLPGSPAFFVFGFSSVSTPLPGGCTLHVAPFTTSFVPVDPKGRAVLSLTVPPGILATFNVQVIGLDPSEPGGLVATNGVNPQAL